MPETIGHTAMIKQIRRVTGCNFRTAVIIECAVRSNAMLSKPMSPPEYVNVHAVNNLLNTPGVESNTNTSVVLNQYIEAYVKETNWKWYTVNELENAGLVENDYSVWNEG